MNDDTPPANGSDHGTPPEQTGQNENQTIDEQVNDENRSIQARKNLMPRNLCRTDALRS